jgi:hypothetical protein
LSNLLVSKKTIPAISIELACSLLLANPVETRILSIRSFLISKS